MPNFLSESPPFSVCGFRKLPQKCIFISSNIFWCFVCRHQDTVIIWNNSKTWTGCTEIGVWSFTVKSAIHWLASFGSLYYDRYSMRWERLKYDFAYVIPKHEGMCACGLTRGAFCVPIDEVFKMLSIRKVLSRPFLAQKWCFCVARGMCACACVFVCHMLVWERGFINHLPCSFFDVHDLCSGGGNSPIYCFRHDILFTFIYITCEK